MYMSHKVDGSQTLIGHRSQGCWHFHAYMYVNYMFDSASFDDALPLSLSLCMCLHTHTFATGQPRTYTS